MSGCQSSESKNVVPSSGCSGSPALHRFCCSTSSTTNRDARHCNRHGSDVRNGVQVLGHSIRTTTVSMHAFECMRKNFISSGLVIHLPSYYSTGDLRFRLPEPIPAYDGTLDATAFGPACPQQKINLPIPDGLTANAVNSIVNSIFQVVFPDDEDCECQPLIKFHKSYSGNRSDYQCRHACERHTRFQIACCRGMSPVPPRNFGSSISTLYSGYLEVGKVCLAIQLSLTRPRWFRSR